MTPWLKWSALQETPLMRDQTFKVFLLVDRPAFARDSPLIDSTNLIPPKFCHEQMLCGAPSIYRGKGNLVMFANIFNKDFCNFGNAAGAFDGKQTDTLW